MVPTRIGEKMAVAAVVIEPDGQCLEGVEQESFVALGLVADVELDVVESSQQALERGHNLLPRERRTNARVRSLSERHMQHDVLTGDVEVVGLLERLAVPDRRAVALKKNDSGRDR